jgi:hypothetical protein
MESPVVSELRQCILDAQWGRAEAALLRIGVPDHQTLVVHGLSLLVCFSNSHDLVSKSGIS